MSLKVVQWSTGNVGRHAIAGIDARPELELVGRVGVERREGRPGRRQAGRPRPRPRRAATTDADALLALQARLHRLHRDGRQPAARGDRRPHAVPARRASTWCRAARCSCSTPTASCRPRSSTRCAGRGRPAARRCSSTASTPASPTTGCRSCSRGVSERIDEVRCMELLDYSTYDNATVHVRRHGLRQAAGRDADAAAAGRAVAGLGLGGAPARGRPRTSNSTSSRRRWSSCRRRRRSRSRPGTIAEGHDGRAALRGARHARRPAGRACSSTSPGCVPTSARTGRSRPGRAATASKVTGEPNYTLDLQLLGTDGDHNTAGLKATAMRLVNAVEAVVAAPPGLLTALDLPLITGRGLVR